MTDTEAPDVRDDERRAEEQLAAQRLADWQATAGQEYPHLLDIDMRAETREETA